MPVTSIRSTQTVAFPDMKLDWQTNPDSENYAYSMGCFRCHDGKYVLVDQSGKETGMISSSCNLCHQTAWYFDPAANRTGCYLSCQGESHNPKTYTP